jgi:hypothetical protein
MIEKLKKTENFWTDESEIRFFKKSDYIWNHFFDFCGCGNNEEMFIFIRDMLLKLNKNEWGSYDDKSYMLFVYWADSQQLTEHGTTIRCSWLTKLGEEILNDMTWCIENEFKDEVKE